MNENFIDCVKLDLTASAWLQLDTWRGIPNIMAADSENKCTAVRTRIVTNKRQKERLARNVKIRRIMVPVVLISILFFIFAFSHFRLLSIVTKPGYSAEERRSKARPTKATRIEDSTLYSDCHTVEAHRLRGEQLTSVRGAQFTRCTVYEANSLRGAAQTASSRLSTNQQ